MVLELDDGERITLNEGDTIVQRGTMHAWRNETTEWARIYFVVLGALSTDQIKPRLIDGNVDDRCQTRRNQRRKARTGMAEVADYESEDVICT